MNRLADIGQAARPGRSAAVVSGRSLPTVREMAEPAARTGCPDRPVPGCGRSASELPMSGTVELDCPAKVNLSLRVLGRRPDGNHEVATVLQTIDLSDRLTIHRLDRASALQIEVPGGGAPADDSNLVLAAARAFLRAADLPARGWAFRLVKRIPAGAGLGGGSSDAAATLVGLQRLHDRPLDAAALHEAAAAVGADVPFLLAGGTALATGRGEVLQPLEGPPPTPVTVAVPPVEVSTAAVYRNWTPDRRRQADEPDLQPPADRRHALADWVGGNDLEPVARRLHPEVARLVRALEAAVSASGDDAPGTAEPVMSGSGGAVFVIGHWPDLEPRFASTGVRVFRTATRRSGVRIVTPSIPPNERRSATEAGRSDGG